MKRSDRVIVLSERARRIFLQGASPSFARKTVILPNGVPDSPRPVPSDRRGKAYWCFAGRLAVEKGLPELLDVWPSTEKLVVVGDGPLSSLAMKQPRPNIQWTGLLGPEETRRVIGGAIGLILPSRIPENFPTVMAEALAQGVPVVSRNGNAGADFVRAEGVGYVYEEDSEIEGLLNRVRRNHSKLAAASRAAFEQELTLEKWGRRLQSLYESVSGTEAQQQLC